MRTIAFLLWAQSGLETATGSPPFLKEGFRYRVDWWTSLPFGSASSSLGVTGGRGCGPSHTSSCERGLETERPGGLRRLFRAARPRTVGVTSGRGCGPSDTSFLSVRGMLRLSCCPVDLASFRERVLELRCYGGPRERTIAAPPSFRASFRVSDDHRSRARKRRKRRQGPHAAVPELSN